MCTGFLEAAFHRSIFVCLMIGVKNLICPLYPFSQIASKLSVSSASIWLMMTVLVLIPFVTFVQIAGFFLFSLQE
jgi:hypothetical protein